MTARVESAWADHPDYRIDIAPCAYTGQVWLDDLLVAESSRCLVLTETDHVDRLYFPRADINWELFTATDHTTECPFKGTAEYWTLAADGRVVENVAWSYATPLSEVAGIAGYVSFYDEKLRVVVVERWPDGTQVPAKFPIWGDADELVRLVDVARVGDGQFVGPAHGPTHRDVVEGGQLLAEAIVATSKTIADQRVTSASMVFAKAASFDAAVDLAVEMLRSGRTFSTAEVRATQHGTLRGAAILLCDAGSPDVINHVVAMPDVPGPAEAVPFGGFAMPGREIRIVDAAYDPDPERVGPPEINAWVRFRECSRPVLPAHRITGSVNDALDDRGGDAAASWLRRSPGPPDSVDGNHQGHDRLSRGRGCHRLAAVCQPGVLVRSRSDPGRRSRLHSRRPSGGLLCHPGDGARFLERAGVDRARQSHGDVT